MKTIFLIVLLMPGLLFAEQIQLTVSGMVCSFCAQGIKKNLAKIEGIKTVEVDLDSKKVLIETEDELVISDEQISQVINDAGYGIVEIIRKDHEKNT